MSKTNGTSVNEVEPRGYVKGGGTGSDVNYYL